MSLRREIHSAFDGIAPPMVGMSERVVQTVLAENRGRRRKERIMLRLRAPISLVAVLVLVAVVAAVLVGGRIVHDRNLFQNGSPASQPSGSATLGQLEAIPLNLPRLKAGDPCPENLGSNPYHQYGSGPIFADGGPQTTTSWGYFYDVHYYTDPKLTGLVLVRGRDLYSDHPLVFVSKYAAGPIVGTDSQAGSDPLRTELVLDASRPPAHFRSTGQGMWPVRQGLANGWTGCVGIEMVNLDFRETFSGDFPPQ